MWGKVIVTTQFGVNSQYLLSFSFEFLCAYEVDIDILFMNLLQLLVYFSIALAPLMTIVNYAFINTIMLSTSVRPNDTHAPIKRIIAK